MFPSLMLGQNLPAIRERKITHYIYCSTNESGLLSEHAQRLERLGIDCVVNDKLIPSDGDQRSYLFIPFLHEIFRSIRDESIVVMAQPDHVFGHGLARVIESLRPHEYVVCGHPRVCERSGIERYPEFLASQSLCSSSSNEAFVSLALSEIPHPLVMHGLRNIEYYWHSIRRKDHYSTYFKEPPPLCFHAHPEMINVMLGETSFGRFETLDHDFTQLAFEKGRLKVIDDSREFFWTELTREEVYNPTIYNNYWSGAAKELFHKELKWFF